MCARNLCCKSSPYCCPSHARHKSPFPFYFRTCSTATAAHVRQATLELTVILTFLRQANLEVSTIILTRYMHAHHVPMWKVLDWTNGEG